MKKQMLYKELAKYYDLVYSKKDYKKEADNLRKLIRRYKRSKGKRLLEFACGTGGHVQYLLKHFDYTGVDLNEEMLKIAKKKVPGAVFKKGNMTTANIGGGFDVVLCLFSSIGYVKTYPNLKKTLKNFSDHLSPGGIVIFEPWFSKKTFFPGSPHMEIYDGVDIKIARGSTSKLKGNISTLYMQYLVMERNKDIRHFAETHELGLFEPDDILEIMKEVGFKPQRLKKGIIHSRSTYVGVKQ
jgi:ubiquinone/menaquinone biosynthesis C-methylase UbiE